VPVHSTTAQPTTAPAPAARETFVILDTSVLMADPDAWRAYPGCQVVIPLTVIDELDANKNRMDEAGRNARRVLRELEDVRLANGGTINEPVPLPDGGSVRVAPNGIATEELSRYGLDPKVADHRIIGAALGWLRGKAQGRTVQVISNDAGLRIKASVLDLTAREHHPTGLRGNRRRPAGWVEAHVSSDLTAALYQAKQVPFADLSALDAQALAGWKRNQFAVLLSHAGSALARHRGDVLTLVPPSAELRAWGLRSKSKEQQFALDLLLDPEVPLVSLEGAAGTGKTMLAVAAGLEQTFETSRAGQPRYSRMTILRPVIAVGKQELGFLPGDLEDKLGPWFETIVDTMVALSENGRMSHRQARENLDQWVRAGQLTLESVTYLRGRSLQSTYVLVDEVQNLEVSTVKTIVSRLGKGSKGVLIGDTTQIDSPWTSEVSNGLSALTAAFTGEAEYGHVALTKGERSRIADMAADRL